MTQAVTLNSGWEQVTPAALLDLGRTWEHPIICHARPHGIERTFVSESHARQLYLALGHAAVMHPDGAGQAQTVRDGLARAALERLPQGGLWIHDVFGDGETHQRMQVDGVDLLLMHHAHTGEAAFLEGARWALAAALTLHDVLDDGSVWFLHDTYECDWDTKRRHNPSMPLSRALGKSPANTLTLNTHLQVLFVLRRYAEQTGDDGLEPWFVRGMRALERVLTLPEQGPRARRMADSLVTSFLDSGKGPWTALRRKLAWRRLARGFIPAKLAHPWLAHHTGYLDRDLCVTVCSGGYHLLNMVDLLTLYQCTGSSLLLELVDHGRQLCRESDLLGAMERDKATYRPLYLDVLVTRAGLPGLTKHQQTCIYNAIAAEIARLLSNGYAPTLGALGSEPYLLPSALHVPARIEGDGNLIVCNVTPRWTPDERLLMVVNPGEAPAAGTLCAMVHDKPFREDVSLVPGTWQLAKL